MSLARHLRLGGRWTFVGGKGGVGKTTIAAALAIELSDAGEAVTVLSTDPAHSLGDALGAPLGPEPSPVSGVDRLDALEVDADHERDRFLGRHRAAIAGLLERGTYLDTADIAEVTNLTIPGIDELAALLRLLRLAETAGHRIVLDTAPTGHTLRLLELPKLALEWLDALDAMEAKHAAIATAFAGAYRPDEVGEFVTRLRDDLTRAAAILQDPEQTRFVLVTTVEPVVLAESKRYAGELERLGIALAGIVVNRHVGQPPRAAIGERVVYVPELDPPLVGPVALRSVAAAARPLPEPEETIPTRPAAPARVRVGQAAAPPLDRPLYFVGGKGGVGKSTIAAALAVRIADLGRHVLLLGLDPAGSLEDLLRAPVGHEPGPVEGAAGLFAQQLDAEAAWARFRSQYEREVDALFSGLTGSSVTAPYDRQVVERLVDLAPPGLDELMALVEVIDTTEDAAYDALVVDTAPTGHFLRLLELPQVALEWTRTLLRLLLKYREVVGLGSVAERVLQLSRSLKALQARLRDPAEVCFVTVARPESLSVPETADLLARLRSLGLSPGLLLVNRTLEGEGVAGELDPTVARLLEQAPGVAAAAAPRLATAPAGIAALRDFAAAWRAVALSAEGPQGPRAVDRH